MLYRFFPSNLAQEEFAADGEVLENYSTSIHGRAASPILGVTADGGHVRVLSHAAGIDCSRAVFN